MNWSSWFWRWVMLESVLAATVDASSCTSRERAVGLHLASVVCAWASRWSSDFCSASSRPRRRCVISRGRRTCYSPSARRGRASRPRCAVLSPVNGPWTMILTAGVKLSFVTAPATACDEAWPASSPRFRPRPARPRDAPLLLDQGGRRDRRGAEGARDGRAAGRRVGRAEAQQRRRAVGRVPARGACRGDDHGDHDGRDDDIPAPHDAAHVDAQRDLDVVFTAGGHRLRVDEIQTAGGVRRPDSSSATRSTSAPSRSRITCDR